jgi:hypothetical protein
VVKPQRRDEELRGHGKPPASPMQNQPVSYFFAM